MAYKKDVVTALQRVIKTFPEGVSKEHLTAIIELYAEREIKEFKTIIINHLKDLQEQQDISKQDIQNIIDKVMSYHILV